MKPAAIVPPGPASTSPAPDVTSDCSAVPSQAIPGGNGLAQPLAWLGHVVALDQQQELLAPRPQRSRIIVAVEQVGDRSKHRISDRVAMGVVDA